MARRPNYKFERMERDRAKAAKKTARLEAKKKKVDERKTDFDDDTPVEDGLDEGGAGDGAPADDSQTEN
ncbi:MAG: hypothetical protein ACTSRY_00985 [Alphaproteobacteria bacterium]